MIDLTIADDVASRRAERAREAQCAGRGGARRAVRRVRRSRGSRRARARAARRGTRLLRRPRHLGRRPARRRRHRVPRRDRDTAAASAWRRFPHRRSPPRTARASASGSACSSRPMSSTWPTPRRSARPFAALGATLDSGGHALFYERLGAHKTLDLIYTGRLMSGTEAVQSGLFSRVLPADEVLERDRRRRRARGIRSDRGVPGQQGADRPHPRRAARALGLGRHRERRAGGAVRHRRLPRGLRRVPAEATAGLRRALTARAVRGRYRRLSIRVLPSVFGLTCARSRNSAMPSSGLRMSCE